MRNLFLSPTSGPSKIHTLAGEMGLTQIPTESTLTSQLHVYITSDDEKIMESDWFIYNKILICREEGFAEPNPDLCKKVILSTDPYLIDAGVQEIDDEFLKWLIRNPKCEEVGTYLGCCEECDERLCEVFDLQRKKPTHKIMIPTEPRGKILEKSIPIGASMTSAMPIDDEDILEEQLQDEADKYASQLSSASVFREAHIRDFIAGANSNFVKRKIILSQIDYIENEMIQINYDIRKVYIRELNDKLKNMTND